MAYGVNWITKIVTIPTADLTLVSGTRYTLDMADFLAEVRRLEWGFSGGLWAAAIVEHSDTRLDFAGVNYAPFDEIINGYTVEITGLATRVDLVGSNNNLVDVLIANGVTVVPSNSAGYQIITTGGSGLSTAEKAQLFKLWQRFGLDPDNPLEVTPTSIKAGDVNQVITGDGETTSTVTEQ